MLAPLCSSTWNQAMDFNTRRSFLARSAAALSMAPPAFALLGTANAETIGSDDVVLAGSAPAARQAGDERLVRPFTVHVPQARLDDLRRRLAAARWPDKEIVDDASQGVQLATM